MADPIDAALRRVASARTKRDTAAAAHDAAISDFRTAMRTAKTAGASNTAIGTAAKLSRQRVNLATRDD